MRSQGFECAIDTILCASLSRPSSGAYYRHLQSLVQPVRIRTADLS